MYISVLTNFNLEYGSQSKKSFYVLIIQFPPSGTKSKKILYEEF